MLARRHMMRESEESIPEDSYDIYDGEFVGLSKGEVVDNISEDSDNISVSSTNSEVEEFSRKYPKSALTVWEGADSFYPSFLTEENEDPLVETKPSDSWETCPIMQKADILYQFYEDSDPNLRVSQFFSQYINMGFGNINDFMRMNKYQLACEDRDPFNDDEAERKYLNSKPTCFIILGKNINASKNLAHRLAEYWGCIIIDADTLVSTELENNPEGIWGTWMKLTLMKGDGIEPERIFEVIYEKIHSPEARHVGYVLIGVPIIPNADAIIGEEHTSQLDDIMHCDMFPDVIINVVCPEQDMYYLRNKMKYDPTSGIEIDYHILENMNNADKFSLQNDRRQHPVFDEWEEYQKENNKLVDASPMDHCFMTMPHNYIDHLFGEVWYYQMHILPYVERAILGHDQKFVIKLDGRTSSYRMMEILRTKLDSLPLVRAYPVVLMSRQTDERPAQQAEGEEAGNAGLPAGSPGASGTVTAEGASTLSVSTILTKAFEKLAESHKPGIRFRWHWSTWGKRCPVTSTQFNDVEGKSEYACRFMDKIYFIASEEACKTFLENPRPYLSVEEEHLPDHIFITGPRLSGKTTLANFVASSIGGKVFDMKAIDEQMVDDRPVKRATSSLSKMIFEILELIHEETIVNYLFDTYSYHYSLVMYINHYSNINNINDLLEGIKTREDIPTKDLVYREKWFRKYMAKQEVPELAEIIGSKEEYITMIHDFALMAENPIAREWRLPECDRANTLAEQIRLYEGEGMVEASGRVSSSKKTWVVDNAPMNIEFWYYLEVEGILPNRVIFLHDAMKEYENMVSKYVITDLHLRLSENKRAALEKAALELAEQLEIERKAREAKEAEEAAIEEARRIAEEDAALLAENEEPLPPPDASVLSYGQGSPFPVSNEDLQVQEGEKSESIESVATPIDSKSLSSMTVKITNQSLHSTSELLKTLNLPTYEEYCEILENLDIEWQRLKEFLNFRARTDTVSINGETVAGLQQIAKDRTNAALLPQARVKTAYEKANERRIEYLSHGKILMAEDWDESDEAVHLRDMYYKITSIVQFGDTNMFCPIALRNHSILYNGKEQFTCLYRDKTYKMSSQEAEEAFLANPGDYVEFNDPVDYTLFAPRICVVGPIGSGKTTLAKRIASFINCTYYNFDEMMEEKYMKPFEYKIGRKYDQENFSDVEDSDFGESNDIELDAESSGSPSKEPSTPSEAASKELEAIFSDTNVMQTALRNYLVLGKSIPSAVLDAVVRDAWFSEPALSEGIVLDGFPCRMSDIKYMRKRFIVPNLIIRLEVGDSLAVERVFDEFVENWKQRQMKIREELGSQLFIIASNAGDSEQDEDEDEDDYNKEEVMNVVDSFENEEQSEENVTGLEEEKNAFRRIKENIKFWVAEDDNFLQHLRVYAAEENIRWLSLAPRQQLPALLLRSVFAIRTANCLEKSQRIRSLNMVRYLTHEEADELIRSGYHMMSRFSHWCPVQVYEEEDSLPLYRPVPTNDSFPVIFRKHIYYIASLENLYLFESNPLKYIQADSYFPLISIRVCVMGPPKSGKSTLAKRLANEFGIRVVTPGDALRYVLNSLGWCDLARRLKNCLRRGLTVTPELMVEAYETFIMEERCTTGGFIYDGFPTSLVELVGIETLGFGPMIVIHIDPYLSSLCSRIGEAYYTSFYGTMPHFSFGHMMQKIGHWYSTVPALLDTIQDRYQNRFDLSGSISKWQLFDICVRIVEYHMQDIQSYDNSIRDGPHSLRSLCITPYEFESRIGPTTQYCIACWAKKNLLITEGPQPPVRGLFQFQNNYYYLCAAHGDDFLINPGTYFNFDITNMPKRVPTSITSVAEDNLYAEGLCIVTYVDSKKPARVKGKRSLAVNYGQYVYLFANETCQQKFLENPELYCGRKIRYQSAPCMEITIPPILPLGFLEQSVASVVTAAVTTLTEFRPSMSRVNLGIYCSIYIGLQLLSVNPKTEPMIKRWAQGQIRRYHDDKNYVQSVFHDCRLMLKKLPETVVDNLIQLVNFNDF